MIDKKELLDVCREVEICLRDFPLTRDNDTELAWAVWQTFHNVEMVVTKEMMHVLPTFDTIQRMRRKTQNDFGKYLPSDPVVRKRRGLETVWKDALEQMEML